MRITTETCPAAKWMGDGERPGSMKMADSNVRNNDARSWQSSVNDDTADTNSVEMSSPGQKVTTDDAIKSAVSLKATIDSATEIDPDMTDVLMTDLHVDVGPDAPVEMDAAANSDAFNDPNAAVGSDIAADLAAVGCSC